ncbi:DUF2306 domain-containing protein [Mucilaginibacter pedocola]|uniref:DUF2306 domain-containing protein n=1 Tax=Mucilaginibacter pedocola TaxID=1792845 RepID=A0A1S9PHY3_9SPHI|nr:DUF2306 domain-containing protein [Mucilaginibacter pedocola]OOQ60158.1 hypothetical protein BC343_26935 [Mucilaginibacter pedocola]
MHTITYILKTTIVYMLLCVFTFLMLRGIVEYLPMRDDIGFLQFKKDYLHILPWKIAFYTHVFSVILCLLAGFTQFNNDILRDHKKLHRVMGRIYAYDILIINFPAAMIMAIYANGLLPTKTAFVILDCLWFWFTYKAVVEIKAGNVKAHKEHMIRSYALTLSAVTLRLWKIIISSIITIDPLPLYMIDAWMGFVPNLLFAEWLIRRNRNKRRINLTA